MRDGEGERWHLRERLVEHVHEFELDLDGNRRQVKDFGLQDGILMSISKR